MTGRSPSVCSQTALLPAQITVFERGWLSSNNILIHGKAKTTLVDSGYCTHGEQTVALVMHKLAGQSLDLLLNTHLHSDHCGGNAVLQTAYPNLLTSIPPGMANAVDAWDPEALSYMATGQQCPRFKFDALLEPQSTLLLGDRAWQVHSAPGHDPHSVILFEPESKVLISADSLWENGFGVVFPELDGEKAFQEVADTLDLIESLQPKIVIPGHGAIFTDLKASLVAARTRLQSFVESPRKHAKYAGKVLLKFKLLELHRITSKDLSAWALQTPYFKMLHERHFREIKIDLWLHQLAQDLIMSGAATQDGVFIVNT